MWTTYNTFDYFEPEKSNGDYQKIFILNVDYGVAWSYIGEKYATIGNWFWSSPETPKYVNNLIECNNMCIFQSDYKHSKDAITEMQLDLKKSVHAIIGIPLYVLANMLKNGSTLFPINGGYPIVTIPKITNYEGYDISEISWLHIDENITSDKKLLIIMGQQCSGKTTYAKKLQDKGYLIISEPMASSIKRKNKTFLHIFTEALNNNKKGVVIDSTNHTHEGRLIFANIAKEMNIESLILWITRPGYKFNTMNNQKIPETILNIYSKNIQTPNLYDIPYIRII